MTLCLFEDALVAHLAPLTLTRAVYDLRIGARTQLECAVSAFAPDALALHARETVLGVTMEEHADAVSLADVTGGVLLVNGRWRVRPGETVDAIRDAARGAATVWSQGDDLLAIWMPEAPEDPAHWFTLAEDVAREEVDGETLVSRLWHLVEDVPARVAEDIRAMGEVGQQDGADVHPAAILASGDQIHLARGARVAPGAVLDASGGPIRLEEGATVEANAVVPLLEQATAQLSANLGIESLPLSIEKQVRSIEFSASATGVWAQESHGTMMDWFYSSAAKDCRIGNLKAAVGETEYETGMALLTSLSQSRTKGQKVSASIELQFDGTPTRSDKAA